MSKGYGNRTTGGTSWTYKITRIFLPHFCCHSPGRCSAGAFVSLLPDSSAQRAGCVTGCTISITLSHVLPVRALTRLRRKMACVSTRQGITSQRRTPCNLRGRPSASSRQREDRTKERANAPGDSSERITDINEFHAGDGCSHGGLLHDTAHRSAEGDVDRRTFSSHVLDVPNGQGVLPTARPSTSVTIRP